MRLDPWLTYLLAGCASQPTAAGSTVGVSTPRAATATATAGKKPLPTPAPDGALSRTSKSFRDCGELACKAFASASDAFAFVLAERPRVLAIGEAHAQAGGPSSRSTARRFAEDLLPQLAAQATDLVLELWVADGRCGKVEKRVAERQHTITAPQAASNQGEFVELGRRAQALGIRPQALVPTCEQYDSIAAAGTEDIETMLRMIKAVTQRDIEGLLAQRAPERMLVAYGGALHNDLEPRAGFEDFSFGPELSRATSDRYVELDLIVPEQIKSNQAWRSLRWYPHYSAENAGTEAYLYSWAPHAYALVFPKLNANEGTP